MTSILFATRGWALAISAVAFASLPSPADAQLVQNGGFETGSLSGWTTSGPTTFIGVAEGIQHEGTYAAFFGPETVAGISQNVATQAGIPYQIDFRLALDDSATPNAFTWSWNNLVQGSLTNASMFDYTLFSRTLLATGGSTLLQFTFLNPESFWRLDSVTVTAIPEPETTALLGLGLLALWARRKKSAISSQA